jgi:hypothetical protein
MVARLLSPVRLTAQALPVLFLGTLLACSGATEPSSSAELLGSIAGFQKDDPNIKVPETAQRGIPFTVAVTTYGNSCVSKVRTQVVQESARATITPYDKREGKICQDILIPLRHEATLQFPEAGVARVIVHGLEQPSGRTITVERTIRVQ